jgi:hypothetical protein
MFEVISVKRYGEWDIFVNVSTRAVESVHKSSDSDSSIFKTSDSDSSIFKTYDSDSFIKAQYVLITVNL